MRRQEADRSTWRTRPTHNRSSGGANEEKGNRTRRRRHVCGTRGAQPDHVRQRDDRHRAVLRQALPAIHVGDKQGSHATRRYGFHHGRHVRHIGRHRGDRDARFTPGGRFAEHVPRLPRRAQPGQLGLQGHLAGRAVGRHRRRGHQRLLEPQLVPRAVAPSRHGQARQHGHDLQGVRRHVGDVRRLQRQLHFGEQRAVGHRPGQQQRGAVPRAPAEFRAVRDR